MKNKFEYYEIVKVMSPKQDLQEINGEEGVIRGMSKSDETGEWGYAVCIYKDNGFVWDIMECDLIVTGKFATPSDHSIGQSVRIKVDPKTGEGELVDED